MKYDHYDHKDCFEMGWMFSAALHEICLSTFLKEVCAKFLEYAVANHYFLKTIWIPISYVWHYHNIHKYSLNMQSLITILRNTLYLRSLLFCAVFSKFLMEDESICSTSKSSSFCSSCHRYILLFISKSPSTTLLLVVLVFSVHELRKASACNLKTSFELLESFLSAKVSLNHSA